LVDGTDFIRNRFERNKDHHLCNLSSCHQLVTLFINLSSFREEMSRILSIIEVISKEYELDNDNLVTLVEVCDLACHLIILLCLSFWIGFFPRFIRPIWSSEILSCQEGSWERRRGKMGRWWLIYFYVSPSTILSSHYLSHTNLPSHLIMIRNLTGTTPPNRSSTRWVTLTIDQKTKLKPLQFWDDDGGMRW